MVAAAESTLAAFSTQGASAAEEPVKAYSRSELDAISFGKTTSPAPSEPVFELSEAPEASVKTPMKLDKMRAMDSPKQSQPGFSEKLKSIFGTKSGMTSTDKEDKKDKNKNTKAGRTPAQNQVCLQLKKTKEWSLA
jgi:hypothetical protein